MRLTVELPPQPVGLSLGPSGLERIPLKLIHIRHEPGNCNIPGH